MINTSSLNISLIFFFIGLNNILVSFWASHRFLFDAVDDVSDFRQLLQQLLIFLYHNCFFMNVGD